MSKTLAVVFGVIFVIVGLLGFVSNPIVGMGAFFETNLLHDLVHLVVGLILLGVGLWQVSAVGMTMKILGVIYLLLAVIGFALVPESGMLLGIVSVNGADHILHIVLGVVLLIAGFQADKKM
ncbi:DUF4383 domain-containing protein [bacterium]|nr:DUF4383 domain-containing protein [bacterium]MCI0565799.1 DUF4383 domain-containing protein [bacterium]MCI0680323.1 DUF4383 domain-containing protein [bacterium]